jgi:hypothetical protein
MDINNLLYEKEIIDKNDVEGLTKYINENPNRIMYFMDVSFNKENMEFIEILTNNLKKTFKKEEYNDKIKEFLSQYNVLKLIDKPKLLYFCVDICNFYVINVFDQEFNDICKSCKNYCNDKELNYILKFVNLFPKRYSYLMGEKGNKITSYSINGIIFKNS